MCFARERCFLCPVTACLHLLAGFSFHGVIARDTGKHKDMNYTTIKYDDGEKPINHVGGVWTPLLTSSII